LNAKLKEAGYDRLKGLSLDTQPSSVYEFEGEDWRAKSRDASTGFYIDIGKREAVKAGSYDVDQYYRCTCNKANSETLRIPLHNTAGKH
jgi:hypothetical protein